MNFFKGLFWASVLSIIIWVMILSCSYSMIAEVDMRQEKIVHRKAYNQWLCDRALNEHQVSKEWTR